MSVYSQRVGLIFMLLALLCVSVNLSAVGHPEKPNIVILLADDLDWHDVGYHGGPLKTPHIDQLAQVRSGTESFLCGALMQPFARGLDDRGIPTSSGFRLPGQTTAR